MSEQVDRGGHQPVASGGGGRTSRRSAVRARVLRGLSTAARRALVGVTSAAASKRGGVTRSAVKKAVAGKKGTAKKTTATKQAAPATKKAAAKKAVPAKKAAAKKAAPSAKKAAKKAAASGKGTAKKAAAPAKKAPAKKASPTKKAAPTGRATAPPASGGARGDLAERASTLVVRTDEKPWTKAELEDVCHELESDADRLRTELDSAALELADLLRDSGDGSGDDQADAGSKTFEREQEMSLAANTRDMLAQTERALTRIANGTYGVCEGCGNPIGKARLLAFPRATLCVSCKQREERR